MKRPCEHFGYPEDYQRDDDDRASAKARVSLLCAAAGGLIVAVGIVAMVAR